MIWNVSSLGGTVRTTLRQAGALAERGYPVTIVSVVRNENQSTHFFEVPPQVRVEHLADRHAMASGRSPRLALMRRLDRQPRFSTQFSWGRESQASRLTDTMLVGRIARTRGVVVGTRMGINLALARYAHPAADAVAQEHLILTHYPEELREAVARDFPALSLVACLTEADAEAYRRLLTDGRPRVAVVPNSIPDELPPPSQLCEPTVIGVGRLQPMKGFDLLVEAFALVADDHPEWSLRILGDGKSRRRLERRIRKRGLDERVSLPGAVQDVPGELAAASIFVMSSRFEPFGIVVIEAMASGLAIASFACPAGPVELLTEEHNALLAPAEDVRTLANRLDELMRDEDLRRRLGRQAREDVRAFTVSRVTDRWVELIEALPGAGRR